MVSVFNIVVEVVVENENCGGFGMFLLLLFDMLYYLNEIIY